MAKTRIPLGAALPAVALLLGIALAGASPPLAHAQFNDGGGHSGRGDTDSLNNRLTVSVRVVTVGNVCVRAVEAVGYDPRLNQRLFRISFDSGPMTSLGITAYENAFASARSQGDAMAALAAAERDARPYRRGPGGC
jgi:F0F1-type ATP synthase membrane subunit c/vacuolar-type H+-ATPase subunit K